MEEISVLVELLCSYLATPDVEKNPRIGVAVERDVDGLEIEVKQERAMGVALVAGGGGFGSIEQERVWIGTFCTSGLGGAGGKRLVSTLLPLYFAGFGSLTSN